MKKHQQDKEAFGFWINISYAEGGIEEITKKAKKANNWMPFNIFRNMSETIGKKVFGEKNFTENNNSFWVVETKNRTIFRFRATKNGYMDIETFNVLDPDLSVAEVKQRSQSFLDELQNEVFKLEDSDPSFVNKAKEYPSDIYRKATPGDNNIFAESLDDNSSHIDEDVEVGAVEPRAAMKIA